MLREVRRNAPPDPPRGRIGEGELGMFSLDCLQPPEEDVVLGVGDLRCIELVVGTICTLELLPKRRRFTANRLRQRASFGAIFTPS